MNVPKFGMITEGQLFTSFEPKDGYKPIEYAPIPEFDQSAQYVVEIDPIDQGECIYIGVEVKDLEIDDNDEFYE